MNMKKAIAMAAALAAAMSMVSCGSDGSSTPETTTAAESTTTGSSAETTVSETETTVSSAETAASTAETTVLSTETSAVTTTVSETTATTTSEFYGTLPIHTLPVPGVYNFTLPADCAYDFSDITFHAKNYYENHTGKSVQYAEPERLDGNILTIHVYDIEEFRTLDYEYYYVDYHNLKGKDFDGNPVDLESTEQTVWFPGAALDSVDFGDCWGAALYLGCMNYDEDFDKYCVQGALRLPNNAAYAEKYTFLKDIPETNYVAPVGGAKGGSELWMLVPRPTVQKTQIMVKNIDENGNPVGLVYNSSHGTPFILACNQDGWCDFEISFISEADGVTRTFTPYITKDTCVPACTADYIKILN